MVLKYKEHNNQVQATLYSAPDLWRWDKEKNVTSLQVFTVVVVPLLTIFCSGIVSAVVTYKLNSSKQEQVFMRGKLEELFVSVHDFCTTLGKYGVRYLPVMKQEISYNDALDMEIESGKEGWRRDAFRRATMLVTIYFAELQPAMDELLHVRSDMNAVLREHKERYKAGDTDGTPFVEPLMNQLAKLDLVEQHFDALVKKQAARIG